MEKESKRFSWLKKASSTDIISWIIGAVGIGGTICTVFYSDSIVYGVVYGIISQCASIAAWATAIIKTSKKEKEFEDDLKEYNKREKEDQDKIIEQKNIVKKVKKDIEELFSSMEYISNSIKCQSINSDEMLVLIAKEGDKQYKLLSESVLMKNVEDVDKNVIINYAQNYADTLFNIFNRYCRSATDETIKVIGKYLESRGYHNRVSITIKLFNKPYNSRFDKNEDIEVYTAFRDNETYREGKREVGERMYSIGANTDFAQCLNREYFQKNNIKRGDGGYVNQNESFYEYYNCTTVVPLRVKDSGGIYKYFGYYCCDCKNKDDSTEEILDETCERFLFAFGKYIATFLETLDNNWVDRFNKCDINTKTFLEVLFVKIFKKGDLLNE